MTDAPFTSFWMGGYEGADHVNSNAVPLDMVATSGHLAHLEQDHALAAQRGIRTVRESIGWRLAEPAPGHFDFERTRRIATSARRNGLQVVWTFMHYGTPADVDLRDDACVERFTDFAEAAALALAEFDPAPIYNLVNEISFLSWAVSQTRIIHPYGVATEPGTAGTADPGFVVKYRLIRAVLAAMRRVRGISPGARFLHIEPVVHVVAPRDRPELQELAHRIASYQWQSWDMLAGRLAPELGGSPEALDLVGVNHYHSSQWEAGTEQRLHWHLRDERRRPLAGLLVDVWRRYGRPMILAETSHVGEGRGAWLDEVAAEAVQALQAGVQLQGICLYPLVDRHDWDDGAHWHRSGLWDVECVDGDTGARWTRVLSREYAASLAAWQSVLPMSRRAA